MRCFWTCAISRRALFSGARLLWTRVLCWTRVCFLDARCLFGRAFFYVFFFVWARTCLGRAFCLCRTRIVVWMRVLLLLDALSFFVGRALFFALDVFLCLWTRAFVFRARVLLLTRVFVCWTRVVVLDARFLLDARCFCTRDFVDVRFCCWTRAFCHARFFC